LQKDIFTTQPRRKMLCNKTKLRETRQKREPRTSFAYKKLNVFLDAYVVSSKYQFIDTIYLKLVVSALTAHGIPLI
jgi:hypothetical protein